MATKDSLAGIVPAPVLCRGWGYLLLPHDAARGQQLTACELGFAKQLLRHG
jgi:hypothetical protein